jgi:hypothetical protein
MLSKSDHSKTSQVVKSKGIREEVNMKKDEKEHKKFGKEYNGLLSSHTKYQNTSK